MARTLRRVLVVGASLAGTHAAAALRRRGFDGEIIVLGAERHRPYDRPPLTKRVLLDPELDPELGPGLDAERAHPGLALRAAEGLDVRWRLGQPATALDPTARLVRTADGQALSYDGLVIATGAHARTWPGPGHDLDGICSVRDLDDALALRRRLADHPGARVVVVGGGFIGAETAAAALARGCHVTVVERDAQLLAGQVGTLAGAAVAAALRRIGVDIRPATRVTGFTGAEGRLTGVRLDDGQVLPADLAVVGLGAAPATEWLRGSGAIVTPHLSCDEHCRVQGLGPDADVVAAGDVTAWPNPVYDHRVMTVGHWSNAREQAEIAAHNLLVEPHAAVAHAHVPTFWSDIGSQRIRTVGVPALADTATIVDGSPREGAFLVVHEAAGRTVGAVSLDRPRHLPALRRLILERAPFEPARLAPVPPPPAAERNDPSTATPSMTGTDQAGARL